MAAIQSIQPGWFSLKGAAQYTGFSAKSISRAIKAGKLAAREVQVTGTQPQKRIRRADLDAWIEGGPRSAEVPSPG